MPTLRITTVLAILLIAGALPVRAQDRPGTTFTVGLGAEFSPDYFGSKSRGLGPTGAFALQELILPGGFGIGSENALPTDPGYGLRGSFRIVPSRKASGHRELKGLEDIDFTLELGLGYFHITEFSRTFARIRRGFGGHGGWVAETGIDAILRPNRGLVLTAGPRANWGDAEFSRTYFGVTPKEAKNSQYSSFRPDAGLVSLGIELGAQYDFGNGWGLQGAVGWTRLQNDASRSPITKQGMRDQYDARLIVTRSFRLGY